MLRLDAYFRALAKGRRERPVQDNPLNGTKIVGGALNGLFRVAFAMVKNQTCYRVPAKAAAT